jgi:2-keto-3-deoxy-L-rhamnonate aldolase RhmA
MEAAGLPTIVRVPSHHSHHIARALDMGAEGLMLPMVGSAAEAREIIACAKYPPAGRRGVALGVAHDRYTSGPALEKLRDADQRTTIFAQIETPAGVQHAEAIAALEGIDCLWIGQFDLSASLGIAGQFAHPDFLAAEATVRQACARHGKSLGGLVPDIETGATKYRAGFDFICYSGDVWLLRAALADGIDALRKVCKEGTPARRGRAT